MPRPKKIPEQEIDIIKSFEKTILEASSIGELKRAKIALDKVKPILNRYHHKARLLQLYLVLYEGALENWDLDLAKRGFDFVRREARKETRLYLEATFLLAIAHLRDQDLFAAEPLICKVFNNEHLVSSEKQREKFIKEVVERFDQEGAISALAKIYKDTLPEAEIHTRAIELLRTGMSEDELEMQLGKSIPQAVKDFIFRVDQLSKKSLPPGNLLYLPSPREVIKNQKVGNLVFLATKRRLYKYLCDKNSEVYQTWLHEGLDAICSKSYVASAVLSALTDLRIGLGAVAVGVTSLAIQQGLHKFCESHKPTSFMSLRNNK